MIDSAITDPRISNFVANIPLLLDRDGGALAEYKTMLGALAHLCEFIVLAATGVGTALAIALPFDPALVLVINETTLAMWWHPATMADAAAFKQVTAGTLSKVTTNGITFGAKGARLVTLGTSVQTTSDVLHVLALGNRGLGGGA